MIKSRNKVNFTPMILGSAFGDFTEAAYLLQVTARQYAAAGRTLEAAEIIDRAKSILSLRDRWELLDLMHVAE